MSYMTTFQNVLCLRTCLSRHQIMSTFFDKNDYSLKTGLAGAGEIVELILVETKPVHLPCHLF